MKIQIVAVGRLKAGPERELCTRYAERFQGLMRSCGISELKLAELSESPARRPEDRQAEESRAILAALPNGATRLILDERGKTLNSAEFAETLRKLRAASIDTASFIIGGPDGLAPDLRAHAPFTLCFGRLTLPHQIVRALLLEQLYRAGTILTGHPYHRA